MSEAIAAVMNDVDIDVSLAKGGVNDASASVKGDAATAAPLARLMGKGKCAARAPAENAQPKEMDRATYVPMSAIDGGVPYATSLNSPRDEGPYASADDAHSADFTLSELDDPVSPTGGEPRFSDDWGSWEVDRESIILKSICGAGEFGEVWAGKLLGSGDTEGLVAKIAAKSLKAGKEDSAKREEFLVEARFMMQVHHGNIVNLYGVCTVSEPVLIVTEFCDHGNLHNYLAKAPGKGPRSRFNARTLLRFVRESCAGMEYLEDNDFIHRDLAARNVLLDDRLTCKITDFGFAKDVHGLPNRTWFGEKGARIPVRWCAPEALKHAAFSPKSDVWAFGILMYEIFTYCSVELYEGLTNKQVCKAVIKLGYVMAKPAGCPSAAYDVMVQCWQTKPNDRPGFGEIVGMLEAMHV